MLSSIRVEIQCIQEYPSTAKVALLTRQIPDREVQRGRP